MGNKAVVKEENGEEFIPIIFNSMVSSGFKYMKSSKRQHVAQLNTKVYCELHFDAATKFGETNRWKLRVWNLKHYEHIGIGIGCYGAHAEITTTLPENLPSAFNVFITLDRSNAVQGGSDGIDKLIIYLSDIDKEIVTEQKQDNTDDLEMRITMKGSEKATIKSWISKTQMMINANITKETVEETDDKDTELDNNDNNDNNDNVDVDVDDDGDDYVEEEDEPILMKQHDVKRARIAFKTIQKADHHGIEKWEIYEFLQNEKGYKLFEIDQAFTLYGEKIEKQELSAPTTPITSIMDLSNIASFDIAMIGNMSGMTRHQSDYTQDKKEFELELRLRYPFYDDYNLRVLIDGFVRETVYTQNILSTVNESAIDMIFIYLFVVTDNENDNKDEDDIVIRSETMEQELATRSNRCLVTINETQNDNESDHSSDSEIP